MGEPVRIVDVAQQLIDLAGRAIAVEFTGLREGEKLHEELFGDGEPHDVRPEHPLVSHVPVPPVHRTRSPPCPHAVSNPEIVAAWPPSASPKRNSVTRAG